MSSDSGVQVRPHETLLSSLQLVLRITCFLWLDQVVVRMRPPSKEEEEGDPIVQKISSNSISILDHTFTFDSVADTSSTQASLK